MSLKLESLCAVCVQVHLGTILLSLKFPFFNNENYLPGLDVVVVFLGLYTYSVGFGMFLNKYRARE